jgi:hypothetical protein
MACVVRRRTGFWTALTLALSPRRGDSRRILLEVLKSAWPEPIGGHPFQDERAIWNREIHEIHERVRLVKERGVDARREETTKSQIHERVKIVLCVWRIAW